MLFSRTHKLNKLNAPFMPKSKGDVRTYSTFLTNPDGAPLASKVGFAQTGLRANSILRFIGRKQDIIPAFLGRFRPDSTVGPWNSPNSVFRPSTHRLNPIAYITRMLCVISPSNSTSPSDSFYSHILALFAFTSSILHLSYHNAFFHCRSCPFFPRPHFCIPLGISQLCQKSQALSGCHPSDLYLRTQLRRIGSRYPRQI
jgi:hypothetical protein